MHTLNKELVKQQFCKNFKTYDNQANIQRQISIKLLDLLKAHNLTTFQNVLEIGCGTGFLTQQILSNCAVENLFVNDLVDSVEEKIRRIAFNAGHGNYKFLEGDAEHIVFPKGIEAILSTSTFQWIEDLKVFFGKIANTLSKEGLVAFSTFGADNFKEIKSVTGVGLKYRTLEQLKAIVQQNFEIIHGSEWKQVKMFQHPMGVLKHMKQTGVNSLCNSFFGKRHLSEFVHKYQKLHRTEEGAVSLTYHPIIIIARKINNG